MARLINQLGLGAIVLALALLAAAVGPAAAQDNGSPDSFPFNLMVAGLNSQKQLTPFNAAITVTVDDVVVHEDFNPSGLLSFSAPADATSYWTIVAQDAAHRRIKCSIDNGYIILENLNQPGKYISYQPDLNGEYFLTYWQWSLYIGNQGNPLVPIMGDPHILAATFAANDPALGPEDDFGGGSALETAPKEAAVTEQVRIAITNAIAYTLERIFPIGGPDLSSGAGFGLIWQWTKPDGTVVKRYLPIGINGTWDDDITYSTEIGRNAQVDYVRLDIGFPAGQVHLLMNPGRHLMEYWFQINPETQSNHRWEYITVE